MKAGWKTVKLGEVAEIYNGNTVSDDNKKRLIALPNAGLPFLATKDVGFDGVINYDNGINIPLDEAGDFKVARKAAVLVCAEGGSAGRKIGYIDRDVHFGNKLFAVNASSAVLPRYLYHYCLSEGFRKKFKGLMAGLIGGVSVAKFKQIEIPLPPLAEQKQIVALLDEAFAGIDEAKAKAEAIIAAVESLLQSHLDQAFRTSKPGWISSKLGAVGKVSMCKRILKEQTKPIGEIPFYKIGTFGKQPDAYIPSSIYNEFRSKYPFPSKGDILISAAGTIGRRVRYDGEPAYFQDSNIVWIENDEKKVLNNYLYHFYSACEWNSTSGATISRLYNDDLRSIDIVFPASLDDQQAIAAQTDRVISEVQELKKAYEQKESAFSLLKASLLTQAFAGELTA